jgi:hypothetical protein
VCGLSVSVGVGGAGEDAGVGGGLVSCPDELFLMNYTV